MKKIIYSLDYLRIIACVMVIGIHNVYLVSANTQGIAYITVNHFVRLGLPLFFAHIINCLENSWLNIIDDLKKYYMIKFCLWEYIFHGFLSITMNIQIMSYIQLLPW